VNTQDGTCIKIVCPTLLVVFMAPDQQTAVIHDSRNNVQCL